MSRFDETYIYNQRRFEALVKNSSDIIAILNHEGNILYESPAFERILGYIPEDVIGLSGLSFVHPDDLERAKLTLSTVIHKPSTEHRIELKIKHSKGFYLDFELIASNYLEDPNVSGIIVNYRDITESKKLKKELYHLAYYDSLTELPNRKYFGELLKKSITEANQASEILAVAIFDLDNFKFVNDSVGDEIGDELLKKLLQELNQYY